MGGEGNHRAQSIGLFQVKQSGCAMKKEKAHPQCESVVEDLPRMEPALLKAYGFGGAAAAGGPESLGVAR